MWQLAVEGEGRLAAWKTHGVEADADRKHVCACVRARGYGCVPASQSVIVCWCVR